MAKKAYKEALMANWRKVGKIKEAHGLRGDLYVLVFSKDISWADDLEKIALSKPDQEDNPKTYTVKKWKAYKDGLLIQLEGISDRTAAEKLKGEMFFISEEQLEAEEGETIYLSEIEGFDVVDSKGHKLGYIKGFSTNIAQDLLVVEKTEGGEAEIPFVEDFIVDIDFESRKLEMDLPEGIWDLNAL